MANNEAINRKKVKNPPDMILLAAVITLSIIGLIGVSSASAAEGFRIYQNVFYFSIRHGIFLIAGLAGMMVFTYFNYRAWHKLALPLSVLAFILLIIVLVPGIGSLVSGSRRWLRFGPVSFQPSEFARMMIIIYLAAKLSDSRNDIGSSFERFAATWIFPGLMFGVILMEPHFSMGALLMMTVAIFIFLAGANILYLGGIGLMGIPFAAYLISQRAYRLRRITAYLDPFSDPSDKGYHVIQSLKAIVKGGLLGTGLGDGTQKLGYLPEPHTDFILAVLAEELGMVMVAAILTLLLVIVWRGFRIAYRSSDRHGSLLAAGMTLFLIIPAMINIGVVTGLLPPTGIPLTFVSYGGTSLLFSFMAIGIILNVSRQST